MRTFGRVPVRSPWFRGWVAVAATGLMVGTVLWTLPSGAPSPSPTAGPSAAIGSSAAASPDAGGSAGSSSPSAQSWEPFVVPPEAPLADLVATRRDAAGVEPATEFRLTSRTAASGTDLASRLEVAPAIALKVAPGGAASEAVVRPVSTLTPGTSYRFRIRTDAGTVAASWLFRAKQPVHVVTTIPGDQATDVPVSTGIEATFDQDGITGYAGRVRIEPAVPFALEVEGRSLAIVPRQALAERTVYSVTIRRGIGIQGSDVTLEKDVVFRFETGTRESSSEPVVSLPVAFAEVSPAEVPVLRASTSCDQVGGTVDQDLIVYRLPSIDAATRAAAALVSGPSWASWSDAGLVPTGGLPAVLRMTAHLDLDCAREGANVIAFPSKLPAGSYLVVLPHPGRDSQLLLQVTPLALYTSVSETRSLAWVNDTVTGRPVTGSAVRVVGGSALGRTGADGLLLVDTPADLLSVAAPSSAAAPGAPVIVATRSDGAAVLAVLHPTWTWMGADPATGRYWLALETDRQAYRTTDTVRAWGVIRPRAGGSVASVDVRLVASDGTVDATTPALARATATPDRAGSFSVSLPIAGLPLGSYMVALVADGVVAASSWIQVDEIRKPAYRIDVTLDRHILVAGDTFTATAHVAYFDGTPVPALDLAVEYGGATSKATTDATGNASIRLKAAFDEDAGDPDYATLSVKPVHPEEGTITAETDLRVYRSAVWPTVEATAASGTLQLVGRLQILDLAGLERAHGTDQQVPEGGAPVGGGAVQVSVVRLVQHQEETGRTYDWITKRTVPTYEGRTERVSVLSTSRTTDADGRFALSVRLPDAAGQYETTVTAKDPAGRVARVTAYVDAGDVRAVGSWPWLVTSANPDCCETYAVGDPVAVHVERPVGAQVAGADRFLFIVARRGLREAAVQTSAEFVRPFAAADVPNLTILGVEFTGRAYLATNETTVQVRQSTQEIDIKLSTDAASYRPRADGRLAVTTLGPDGRPTSATVFVQAVDEKLYRIGAASTVDLLSSLYQPVPDGIRWSAATHYPPVLGGDTAGGGGGDTTVRADFRDTLLFRQVTTDASGRATIPFTLSDDLTSWRVTAAAVDAALHAGTASVQVPVGLPFFVEATLAPEYLVSDKPVLRLRAYGSSLAAGQAVRFTVAAPTLGLAPTTIPGTAFDPTRLTLPSLSPGTHRIQVTGSTAGRTPALTDSLVRDVRVVDSRYEELTTTLAPLDAAFRPTGGDGLTTYVVADAGQATLAAILERLVWGDGPRIDQALGAAVARDWLVERFGRDGTALPATRFEAATYQRYEGVALLPYAGVDPALAARVALAAPERFDRQGLTSALRASYGDPFSTRTREQGIVALAGLAAVGEPVGAEIDTFARQPSLTVRERLYLGIAYAEAGDDGAARVIEREVLASVGRQMGPWVRLDVSPARDDVVEATGLLAVLAASIGDPVADRAQAYLEANPPKRTLQTLEELAFVRHSLDRLAPEAARFAYTVDGVRHVVDLAAERSFTLTLTAAQRASLRLERLAGDVSVTTSWLAPARQGSSPPDPDVRIARTVSPGLSVGEDQMVRVRLTVTFGSRASDQCYSITEPVPSGLAPLPRPDPLAEADVDPTQQAVIWPTAVTGQLVSFCASPTKPTVEAVYSARVVSPGTYTWEPATIGASAGTGLVSLSGTSILTIR